MRKLKGIFLISALLFLMLVPVGAAYASPGSAGDPLVSKSWVDSYVEEKFAPLEEQLNQLKVLIREKLGIDEVSIELYIGKNTAYVNGRAIFIDPDRPAVTPQLKTDASGGGYTMVPVRFVAESMGLAVEWLPSTRQVVFSDVDGKIVLNIDNCQANIDGQNYTMGYAPFIENQRTYVHIRFVAEAFNCQVGWNQSEKRVDVTR